jgi:phosphoglycerol transferase
MPRNIDCSSLKKDLYCAALLFLICITIIVIIFDLAEGRLNIPLSYNGDTLPLSVAIRNDIDTGFWTKSLRSGAPIGTDYIANVFNTQNFEELTKWILAKITKDVFIAENLYYFSLIVSTGVISFFVFRRLQIGRLFAIPASLTYAFSPYIFWRNVGHLSYSPYHFVPLSVLLCVWLFSDDRFLRLKGFWQYRRNILAIIFMLLISTNGTVYYPSFTFYMLVITGLYCLLANGKKIVFIKSLVMGGFVIVSMALNAFPLVCKMLSGDSVWNTSPAEAEIHGLKIIQMFMPISGHGFEPLQNFIDRYNQSAPLVHENIAAYIGMAGCVGLILAVFIFLKRPEGWPTLFSNLNVFLILLCTIGGFGSMLAFMGMRFLRGYNRVSIFIMFLSLAILCYVLQHISEKLKTGNKKSAKVFVYIAVFLFFSVGIVEQIAGAWILSDNSKKSVEEQFNSDKRYFTQIEEFCIQETQNASPMIFQLPYAALFGTDLLYPKIYNDFIPFLQTEALRWSGGGLVDTKGDFVNRQICDLPSDELVKAISKIGFDGIMLDKLSCGESFEVLNSDIRRLTNVEPIISEDDIWYFYSLKNYITDNNIVKDIAYLDIFTNLHYETVSGFFGTEKNENQSWIWCDKTGELKIINNTEHDENAHMSFKVLTPSTTEMCNLKITSDIFVENYQFNNDGAPVSLDFTVPAAGLTIRFETDAPKLVSPDPRDIYFGLFDFELIPRRFV